MTTTVEEKRQFGREIPEAVSYAVGHRIRVERTEKVRSVEQRFYTVLDPIYVDEKEMTEMGEEKREELIGLTHLGDRAGIAGPLAKRPGALTVRETPF